MTPPSFHRLVDEYLTARRGLGFDLETAEGLLRNFASHADRIGHGEPVTIELAVQWARSSRSSNPAQAVHRLAVVRQFARYRALFDPATEIHRSGSWDASRAAQCPTSTARQRWPRSCSRQAACCPETGCDPPPMSRTSPCWPRPACGSPKPAVSRPTTPTSSTAS